MKRATDLSRQELEQIVEGVQQLLYLDAIDDSGVVWNPDKELSGADVCQDAVDLLNQHGLAPEKKHPFVPLRSTSNADR